MKKNALLALSVLCLAACSTTSTKVTSNSNTPDINQVAQQHYNGPKARIAVSRFTDKSNNHRWYNKEIGNGMADQLTTALVGTNRFIVLERQALDAVTSEQDLVTAGRVSHNTGASYGEIEGAEIVVVASITEFDDGNSGTTVGGGGVLGNVLGAVSAGFKGTHMAIDLRLIDTRTSRVLAATSVEGGSKDFNITGAALNFGSSLVGGGLDSWSNTPKEKALREVIIKAVDFTLKKIPDVYYRHSNAISAPSDKPMQVTKPAKVVAPTLTTKQEAVTLPTKRLKNYERVDLRYAQAELHCLGYLRHFNEDEDVDMYDIKYDEASVRAIRTYQQESALTVSGFIDAKTKKSLEKTNCTAKTIESSIKAFGSMFGVDTDQAEKSN